LLATQGRRLEVLFPTETEHELVHDFVSVITSMAARVSGRRNSKGRAEQIKGCIDAAMKVEQE
jgi:predicted site-specific integrase-resolvase